MPLHVTLTQQIVEKVRDKIERRAYTPGTRLPSIRRMAADTKVSNATVVEAYDRLVAEGLIRAKPGSGYFVIGHAAPLDLAKICQRLDRAIDPLWVSRQALDATSDMLMPGCGWLPASWLPCDLIRRALRTASRGSDEVLTEYAPPLGHTALRQFLARQFSETGLDIGPDQLLMTDSANQALDLVCRFFLEPGDTVFLDDPCYFNFRAMMAAHRVNVVGVPMTRDGPDLDALEHLLATHAPRLYITNCVLHNPTGVSISPVTAHRLLNLAEKNNLLIVEDDVFSDLDPDMSPRLAAYDGLQHVIQIGSFSKTLSASVRCGYVVSRPEWIEALADLKVATGFSGGRLEAEVVYSVLLNGSYRRHLDSLRARLADAMGKTLHALPEIGVTPWHTPCGGMFVWCKLPDRIEASNLARYALDRGVVLAPGDVFSHGGTDGNFMRFNVAQMQSKRAVEFLAKSFEFLSRQHDELRNSDGRAALDDSRGKRRSIAAETTHSNIRKRSSIASATVDE